MTATDKLVAAFVSALEITEADVTDELRYDTHKKWDSTAHMLLIARLESDFEVLFDVDDIINMNSFSKAKELLSQCDGSITF